MKIFTTICVHMKFFYLILQLQGFLVRGQTTEPSVNLTVEGGVSLVGPHCPGTVRLFCEGVDLILLRWNYNDTILISSFNTVDSPTSMTPSNPAFVTTITLSSVQQNPSDPRFASFTSTLTVDLARLQEQGVTNINCGAPGSIDTKPIDVQIVVQTLPENPTISNVTANYQSGLLKGIVATWGITAIECLTFGESLVYEVALTGLELVTVNRTSCGEALCVATIPVGQEQRNRYILSLMARNSAGSSDAYVYPNTIEQRREQYFSYDVEVTRGCQAMVQCTVESSTGTCTIKYSTDSDFQATGKQITDTSVPVQLTSGTTYYFQFSVLVNGTLSIIEAIQITANSSSCNSQQQIQILSDGEIAAVTVAVILIGTTLLLLLILFALLLKSRARKKIAIAISD